MYQTVYSKRSKGQKHRKAYNYKAWHHYIYQSLYLLCIYSIISLMGCKAKQPGLVLPYYNTPDFTPHFITSLEATKKITHTIDSFSFEDQDGVIITDHTIAGKIHIANFMFTSCGSICPVMTENLSKVSKAFLKDSNVVLLSYSVTPWIDTKERLKNYRIKRGVADNPNWHFLTGNKGEIYQLARRSYFAEEDLGFTKDSTEFLHTEHVLLVDGTGRIRGIYNGTLPLEMDQLIKDIQAVKSEMENVK